MKYALILLATLIMLFAFGCRNISEGYKDETIIHRNGDGSWRSEENRTYKYFEEKQTSVDSFMNNRAFDKVQ